MENQALISVIIPVYNVEKYLCECIDSVLNQTYQNFEIILVDDGSTDSSGKICDAYANNSKVKVIHIKNSGLSVARNTGFDESRGEYVYFLDSDDYIVPEALKEMNETAQKNASDIVYFDAVSFADSDDFSVSQNYIRKNKYSSKPGFDVLKEMQDNDEYHSAVQLMLFSRSFLEKFNLRFVPGIYHEDAVFTYEAFFYAKTVSQCARPLYFRRYRKDSIMTSKKSRKHFLSMVAVYNELKDFSIRAEIIRSETAKKYIIRYAYNCFNTFEMLNNAEKEKCKSELKSLKHDILENNSFDDKALRMRCYGKIFWFGYKCFEKIF